MSNLTNIIIIIWILFWFYWLLMALGSKKNSNSRFKQYIGMRFLFVILFFILFRSFFGHNLTIKNYYLDDSFPLLIFGFVIFILGLALAIWARIYLGRNWGAPMTLKKDPELITTGPYSYIRHPIYTGLLLAGIGSVISGGIFYFIFLIFATPYFIYSSTVEEKIMIKQFPKDYPKYRSKTKKLIPFIY